MTFNLWKQYKSVCSVGHEKYLQQNYSSRAADKNNVSLAKTTNTQKSAKQQDKNQEKNKKKTNKQNHKNNNKDTLATVEAMTDVEPIPKFAWLD
jgi:hypothetical protein